MPDIVKGQPIVLPDGSMLLPEANASGSKVVSKEEIVAQETQERIMSELDEVLDDPLTNAGDNTYKRTLADINVPFKQMNLFMLVTAYSMWGLDDYAISRVLDTSVDNIARLKQSHMFTEIQQQLVEAVRYAETASVHGYLADKARMAAKTVVSTLASPSGDLKLAAAKDILDRAGFRPADRVEHVMRFEDELRIVHLEETKNTDIKLEY